MIVEEEVEIMKRHTIFSYDLTGAHVVNEEWHCVRLVF